MPDLSTPELDLPLLKTIRNQANSKLDNQKHASNTLRAVEEAIVDSGDKLHPVAYFGVLMTMMNQHKESAEDDSEGVALLVSCSYILSIICPRIPKAIYKAKFNDVVGVFVDIIQKYHQEAPIVKSIICCLEIALMSQDGNTWSHSACKEALQSILFLSTDARPKVRKRAQEAVKMIISHPPLPMTYHPGGISTLEFCIQYTKELLSHSTLSKKDSSVRKQLESQMLHILSLLRCVIPLLVKSAKHAEKVQKLLLDLAKNVLLSVTTKSSGTGNLMITESVFSVLMCYFGEDFSNDVESTNLDMVRSILESMLQLQPNESDTVLTPLWTRIVAQGLCKYSGAARKAFEQSRGLSSPSKLSSEFISMSMDESDGNSAATHLKQHLPVFVLQVFSKAYYPLLSSTKEAVFMAAAEAFASICANCITLDMIQEATNNPLQQNDQCTLLAIIHLMSESLVDIRYKEAWGGIMGIAKSLFMGLGGNHHMLVKPILERIINFRDDNAYVDAFPFKQELESAIMSAIISMGLDQFFVHVPHNVEGGDVKRPYLLSLVIQALEQEQTQRTDGSNLSKQAFSYHSLKYYACELLPLSSRLFARSAALWKLQKAREAKLLETLATQIWNVLPGICSTVPKDVGSGGFEVLAPMLGRILQSTGGHCPLPEEYTNQGMEPLSHFVDLKPVICTGLHHLVSNYIHLSKNMGQYDENEKQYIESGLACLTSFASRFLSTLCNNFTSPDGNLIGNILEQIQKNNAQASNAAAVKNQVLQTFHEKENQKNELAIRAYVQIANVQDVDSYFMTLVGTLLQIQTSKKENATAEDGDIVFQLQEMLRTYSIIDLLLILLPHLSCVKILSSNDHQDSGHLLSEGSPVALFYRVMMGQLPSEDVTLEKRTYKALNAVIEIIMPAGTFEQPTIYRMNKVLPLLEDLATKLVDPNVLATSSSGSKKTRIELLGRLVHAIPLSCDVIGEGKTTAGDDILLALVPVALSEIMLATKEASEKARTAAFETLVIFAKKMLDAGKKFGTHGQSEEFDDEMLPEDEQEGDVKASQKLNFRELLMMVVAGLAGSSSNMQSASISCVARLLFEFRSEMSNKLINDVITTIMCMIQSPNNEVIKAALGFVKVVVLSIEPEFLVDHLENIVVSILTHSRKHSSHFKVKVRHLFERLIKKFSFEAVEGFVPDEDKKLLVNIRKRRERAKRQKNDAMQTEQTDSTQKSKQKSFEKAILGSDESDLGSDDDGADKDMQLDDDLDSYLPDDMRTGSKKSRGGTKIVDDTLGEEVLDFLNSNVVSRVTSGAKSNKVKKSDLAVKKQEFEFNAKGKLVIHDSDEEREMAKKKNQKAQPQKAEENLYLKSLKSEVALERMPSGKMKFVNKRKRDEDDEDYESDDDITEDNAKALKEKRAEERALNTMLGRQFKAKNARGDVKKGNVDPYAYIPLNAKIGSKSRKKAKSQGQFKNIIKAAQKGAEVKASTSSKHSGIKKSNKRHK